MKEGTLWIVGQGNMASLAMKANMLGWPEKGNFRECMCSIGAGPREDRLVVAFHCGSGRLFTELVAYCNKWHVPLIQASSSLKDEGGKPITPPTEVDFPLILAPNLALPIAALLMTLPMFGVMMQKLDANTNVLESHQSTKTSAPITAWKMAGYFGTSSDTVCSIRDKTIQKMLLGIPGQYLDGHAYHQIKSTACDVEIGITMKIHGRNAYILGLEVLLRKIEQMGSSLKPGVYQAEQLIFG